MRGGWGSIPAGFPTEGQYPCFRHLCIDFSLLAAYAGPLGLLAAGVAFRIPERKQVGWAVLSGAAAPLFLALSISGAVGVAIYDSGLYQPSLQPTIAMALWSHVAGTAMPGRMLIAAITTFGALRFAAGALATCGGARVKVQRSLLACAAAPVTWLAVHQYSSAAEAASKAAATCLVVVGAVVTADFLSGRARAVPAAHLDTTGVAALLAGLATSFLLAGRYPWRLEHWWLPWLLPSYMAAFLACLCGRLVRDASRRC